MKKVECVAMLLAGGQGTRLGALTQNLAKPAVPFGGKYRIIDFALSNCTNSGIEQVGVLTQYQTLVLHSYLGNGTSWDLDRKEGGLSILPPYAEQNGGSWYRGTAHAIYQNIHFIEQYNPQYVLVLSGDHIYKMNYNDIIEFHKSNNAEATIAVIEVNWDEASRFGIMTVDGNHRVVRFEEKPEIPQSNLASMGVYVFDWETLRSHLMQDTTTSGKTGNDFGKDIIPRMLGDQTRLYAYPFKGYWKDVGTVESLWEANMDLLKSDSELNLRDKDSRIYSLNPNQPAHYIGPSAKVKNSLLNEGCEVYGEVDHSVLFYGVSVGENSVVKDSVIMPNVKIGENVRLYRCIINEGITLRNGASVGSEDKVTLIGGQQEIS